MIEIMEVEEKWVTYQEGEEYLIRYGGQKFLELQKQEGGFGDEKNMRTFFDFVLKDWKGINMKGKPAEPNAKNKALFLEYHPERAYWVIAKAQNPVTFGLSVAQLKNLSGPSSSS